jgi:hypothetical protein
VSVIEKIYDLTDAWFHGRERAYGCDLNLSVGMYETCKRAAVEALGNEEVASIFEAAF